MNPLQVVTALSPRESGNPLDDRIHARRLSRSAQRRTALQESLAARAQPLRSDALFPLACPLGNHRTRAHFPTDDALIILLYLGCRELGRTDTRGQGGRAPYNWKIALNQFAIMFPGRLDQA